MSKNELVKKISAMLQRIQNNKLENMAGKISQRKYILKHILILLIGN